MPEETTPTPIPALNPFERHGGELEMFARLSVEEMADLPRETSDRLIAAARWQDNHDREAAKVSPAPPTNTFDADIALLREASAAPDAPTAVHQAVNAARPIVKLREKARELKAGRGMQSAKELRYQCQLAGLDFDEILNSL